MNFKKGDIISNSLPNYEGLQWVKLLSNIKPNTEADRNHRRLYPYKAKVIHIKGEYVGEIVEGYHISIDSILIKHSGEFLIKDIKSFKFCN